ncbi:MAG: isoprenylcysteine carboxylmethyltransferase family protein [Acidobacteriia bacterium]|nr:isoprenylcysteine carboxylmethyltransferase family protein [Terriglobia bacterium]
MTKSTKSLVRMGLAGIAAALLVRHIPPGVLAPLELSVGMKLSLVLWLLFSVYWSIAAKDSAATKTSEPVWSRQLHLILVNGALLLLVFSVPGLTRRFLPSSRFLVATGLMIQAVFILLAVWARQRLGSNWSGEVRIAAEHQLVRSGPYRFIRHPIYTAVLGMYCGTALVSGEIHAPVALVMVTLTYWRKIRLEERALGDTFGAEYDAYRRDTWALVPPLY